MPDLGVMGRLVLLLIVNVAIQAQTVCGTGHEIPGVFICYPNPGEHQEDQNVSTEFHLSAQVNAPPGRRIGHYVVQIDGRNVYQSRLSLPMERLSIETNV